MQQNIIQREEVAVRFYHHPDFEKELAKFIKKHCQNNTTLDTVLRHIQNLLTSYFEHNKPVFPNLKATKTTGSLIKCSSKKEMRLR